MKTHATLAFALLAAGCADGPGGPSDVSTAAGWATGRIVYSVQKAGEDSQLYLMDVARRHVQRIATAPPAEFFGLSWAGGTITFSAFPRNSESWQVFGIEPDGRNRRVLFPSDRHSWFAAISKQGRLAYFFNDLGMGFKGTAVDGRYAIDRTTETRPAWSPDGVRLIVAPLAVASGATLQEYDVTRLPATRVRTVFTSPSSDRHCYSPIYSPDGRRVAFTLSISARAPGERLTQEIWVTDADGTNAHAVTSGALDDFAAWSPDGTMLAFTRSTREAPASRLHVVRPDGTELAPLLDREASHPAWAP